MEAGEAKGELLEREIGTSKAPVLVDKIHGVVVP